jgi:hypothetical protein
LFVLQQSLEIGFFIVVGIVWKVFIVIGLNHLGLWFGWGFGWGSYFFLAIIIFFAALLFDFTVTLFSFNCSQFLHHDFIMVIRLIIRIKFFIFCVFVFSIEIDLANIITRIVIFFFSFLFWLIGLLFVIIIWNGVLDSILFGSL